MSFYLSWWSRWRGTHRGRCCRPVCWSDRWFCLEWWWMRFQTSAHISKIMSMCISLMIRKRYLSIFWSPLLGIDTYKVDCSFGQFHYNSCSIWYLHHFQVNETVLINHIRPWELCQHYFSDCRSSIQMSSELQTWTRTWIWHGFRCNLHKHILEMLPWKQPELRRKCNF